MTRASRQAEQHCPDCGRPVAAGADLCSCGFPLMFLRQEEPEAAVLKPSRRPAEDSDDTDELPVVEAPLPRPAAQVPVAAPAASVPLDGVVCASCDEVNPSTRTWCAHCGAALRERRDLTQVLVPAPAPPPRRRALLVAAAATAVVVVGGGAAAAVWALGGTDGTDPRSGTADVGPLAIGPVTASETARDGKDNADRTVTYVADHVRDGDRTTAWRVLGDGVGVEIVLPLDGERTVTQVALVPGYAKTDPVVRAGQTSDRFQENGRVTGVRWVFDEGASHTQEITTPTRDWARDTLDEPVTTSTVTLVIEASEPGTRTGRTTAISEVQVVGR